MSATLVAPQPSANPTRQRRTVEEYYRLMNLGLMEGRFEIIDGEAISKMGQNPPPARTIKRLIQLFARLGETEFVGVQGPIRIPGSEGLYTEPEPDFVLTRETEDAYSDRHPGTNDLRLVIEVSEASLRDDLLYKAGLYARAGIVEYWVVDIASHRLHVHREPSNGKYTAVTVYTEADTVTMLSRPQSPIAVADILPLNKA